MLPCGIAAARGKPRHQIEFPILSSLRPLSLGAFALKITAHSNGTATPRPRLGQNHHRALGLLTLANSKQISKRIKDNNRLQGALVLYIDYSPSLS
jgi:hypothetical protein